MILENINNKEQSKILLDLKFQVPIFVFPTLVSVNKTILKLKEPNGIILLKIINL